MQKIIPNIWFDHAAREAVDFYLDAFGDHAREIETTRYPTENLPEFQREFAGEILTIEFELYECRFVAINAGSEFRPGPALSFMVNFDPSIDADAEHHLRHLWQKLTRDGTVRMELSNYDFSTLYGWVEDKYGVNWQLILTNPAGEPRPTIIPSLLFTGSAMHQANAARQYYVDTFSESHSGRVAPYPVAMGDMAPNDIMFSDFVLADQWFTAMDGGSEHEFSFTEGVSLQVNCKDQEEIDYLWNRLSAYPENEQCGWCKDRFGVSWQIVPQEMGDLMKRPGAYQVLLDQKKIRIDEY